MLSILHKLGTLLDPHDRGRLVRLGGVLVVMAILEVMGIATVLPFLHLASEPEGMVSHPWYRWGFDVVGFTSHRQMLACVGGAVIGFLLLSNLLGAFSMWLRHRVASSLAHSVSVKMVHAYKRLPYIFFLKQNSAQLIRKVIDDVTRLVTGVLLGGCQLFAKTIASVVIFALLVFIRPWIAMTAFVLFAGVYLVIFLARRNYLLQLGKESLDANYDRYRGFVDYVSGMKSIRSSVAHDHFIDRFEEASHRFSLINPKVQTTSEIPRYFVETIAFAAVVGLVLLFSRSQGSFSDALPELALFAVAGYRLLPAVNGAYASATQVVGSLPAIESLYADIARAEKTASPSDAKVEFKHRLCAENVTFTYEPSSPPVVETVSLEITKGSKVAFVGPTGSGKTTFIDILIGLLDPVKGSLRVDDVVISNHNLGGWQDLIGYVPQDVFLYDETIANNIAFGKEMDRARIRQACEVAKLTDFIDELPLGLDTQVGERGVRMSGGQRQRLGLARAIYRQPELLVLDEATSALDSKTEEAVVSAIYERLPGITVVMIAHRISTVRRCDQLFIMDRGKVVNEGTYEELLSSSQLFRELARFT